MNSSNKIEIWCVCPIVEKARSEMGDQFKGAWRIVKGKTMEESEATSKVDKQLLEIKHKMDAMEALEGKIPFAMEEHM
jgi:hypothetical protein